MDPGAVQWKTPQVVTLKQFLSCSSPTILQARYANSDWCFLFFDQACHHGSHTGGPGGPIGHATQHQVLIPESDNGLTPPNVVGIFPDSTCVFHFSDKLSKQKRQFTRGWMDECFCTGV